MNTERFLDVRLVKEGLPDYVKKITVSELMNIEDIDLRKCIFMNSTGQVLSEIITKKVDNDEKIGYYRCQSKLCMSKNGKIYTRSILLGWIVYKKSTGKVNLSINNTSVYKDLLKEHFYYTELISLLSIKVTSTLCKKIIEGSISTIYDFVKYFRSYVVKKDISVEALYKFIILKGVNLLHVIEDPESILRVDTLPSDVNFHITSLKLFTCKLSEVNNLNDTYNDWNNRQMSKFIKIKT